MRILYGFVAIVFLLSTVVQFHHHHDDGGMCMCFHTDVCKKPNDVDRVLCAGECVSEAHHHCSDEGCSLHLSDTVMSSVGNSSAQNHIFVGHIHGIMYTILCSLDLTVFANEARDKIRLSLRDDGKVSKLFVSGWGFRAPPVA